LAAAEAQRALYFLRIAALVSGVTRSFFFMSSVMPGFLGLKRVKILKDSAW
jgi:hypothetical protein